jgi:hypothetical protein
MSPQQYRANLKKSNRKRTIAGFVFNVMVLIFVLIMLLTGCAIPIRTEFDASGKPKAIPVTPVGSQNLKNGAFTPVYPVSNEAPSPPPQVPWDSLLQIGLAIAGIGGGGYGLLAGSIAGKAKKALQIACAYAEKVETCETPDEIKHAKNEARLLQNMHGVHSITQSARNKRA